METERLLLCPWQESDAETLFIRILIIIFALVSTTIVDAQNEVIGGCVKKDGMASGINATSRFLLHG